MPEIYCKDCEHFDKCVRGYMPDCPVYYPKKGIMTNEEWLKQCTTEQLAEVLFSWYKLGRLDVINKHTELKKDWLIGWLKQPHNSPK